MNWANMNFRVGEKIGFNLEGFERLEKLIVDVAPNGQPTLGCYTGDGGYREVLLHSHWVPFLRRQ